MKILFLVFVMFCCFLYVMSNTLVYKTMTADELENVENRTLEECRLKYNVDEKMVEDYFNDSTPLPTNEEFKCMLSCQDELLGYVKNGKPDWELMKIAQKIYYADEDNVAEYIMIIDNCKNEGIRESAGRCDLSYQITDCMLRQYREIEAAW